jgi:hypothetical protein
MDDVLMIFPYTRASLRLVGTVFRRQIKKGNNPLGNDTTHTMRARPPPPKKGGWRDSDHGGGANRSQSERSATKNSQVKQARP